MEPTFSDADLILLWERWDQRPGDAGTADLLQGAIEAWSAERNKEWLQVRRAMQALTREGYTRAEALESIEL